MTQRCARAATNKHADQLRYSLARQHVSKTALRDWSSQWYETMWHEHFHEVPRVTRKSLPRKDEKSRMIAGRIFRKVDPVVPDAGGALLLPRAALCAEAPRVQASCTRPTKHSHQRGTTRDEKRKITGGSGVGSIWKAPSNVPPFRKRDTTLLRRFRKRD